MAAVVSIIVLAFLSVLRLRPTKPLGAAEVAEAASELEELGSFKAKLLQEDGGDGGEGGADAEQLIEWRLRTFWLVNAVERNRLGSPEYVEAALQQGIPLVKQARAKLEGGEVPDERKEELEKATQAAQALLRRASRRLTGLWEKRAQEATAKVEGAMQLVLDAVRTLPPCALVGAKDEAMLKVKRLKRFIEAAWRSHTVLKLFSEEPMPITALFKKVQELEHTIEEATSLLFNTLKGFQQRWEEKDQVLRDIIQQGGPDAARVQEELKLHERKMTAALRKIEKLSTISPVVD